MTAESMDFGMVRRSPLGALTDAPLLVGRSGGVTIVELPFRPQVVVRIEMTPDASAAIASRLGVRPPRANRVGSAGQGRLGAIWLGPDEWLFVMPGATITPRALEALVAETVAPFGGSAVDVSAQRTILDLSGPSVRDILASGCSVDLHPRFFEVGQAAQTQFARVDVILTRVGGDAYRVFVRASFARYLAAWLIDASATESPIG